jgi:aminoglycoside phosphotransferase (APT) family kinase protein
MDSTFSDIPEAAAWAAVEEIHAGWSKDRKYLVRDRAGQPFVLRTAERSRFQAKQREFRLLQKFNALNFPMSQALSMGLCSQGQLVYLLLSWVEGQSLETALPGLPPKQQFQLGLQAGKILRSMHDLPVEDADRRPFDRGAQKLRKFDGYVASPLRVPGDESAVEFVRANLPRIDALPLVYQHGDFHTGNLLLTPAGAVGVIDFNRCDCGDRYEEFYKLESFSVEVSAPFSVGQIQGYFSGPPPAEFWEILAIYAAYAALYSIVWAIPFGDAEIQGMQARCRRTFADYDGFRSLIPRWYREFDRGNSV